MSNWVEQRYILLRDSHTVWEQVRTAAKDACASFNAHFLNGASGVSPKERDRHLLFWRHLQPKGGSPGLHEVTISFYFGAKDATIEVKSDRLGIDSLTQISIDEDGMFIGDSRETEMSADQFSMKFLKPFLFPSEDNDSKYIDPNLPPAFGV